MSELERPSAQVERMLARARKRLRQVEKIVAKWENKKAELGREAASETQPRLFQEEPSDGE